MQPTDQPAQAPALPPEGLDKKEAEEIKKKLDQLKVKIDKFKNKLSYKHEKAILGISVLPPEKLQDIVDRLRREGIKSEEDLKKRLEEEKEKINVLLLLDDQEAKGKTTKESFALLDKVEADAKKIAQEIDKNLKPQAMLMAELREACFDGKHDILRLVSLGAIVQDKKDVLKALKVSEIHKSMVIKKFEKYVVSYIAVGSLFRGDASSHDIDVAIIIDDTDVKRMSRTELRDKLGSIIRSMGFQASDMAGVKKVFHIQVYILTDFWDGIRDATPVFFTFLRDGIPLYDRGVFMPQKLLLNMGRIKPSPEAIELHMDVGERLVDRAKGKMLGIIAEDVYYAVLNPSQAALMLNGYPPSTPKETIRLMGEVFVKKEKLLEKKYVDILARTFKLFKEIEHGTLKEVSGKQIDKFLGETVEYTKRIKKLVAQLNKRSSKTVAKKLYEEIIDLLKGVFQEEKLSFDENKIKASFMKLVKQEKFTKEDSKQLEQILTLKKATQSKEEVEKVRRESSILHRKLREYVQRKRGLELERAKIRFKYGETFGELYLLDNNAYVIDDIDAKDKKVRKAEIKENGSLGKLRAASLEELEKALVKVKVPKQVFIKEPIFEDLRKIFGKFVEISVNW